MKSLQSANVRHRVSEPLNFKHSYTLEVFNAIDDKRDFIFFSQVFFAKVKKKLNYVRNCFGRGCWALMGRQEGRQSNMRSGMENLNSGWSKFQQRIKFCFVVCTVLNPYLNSVINSIFMNYFYPLLITNSAIL